MTHFIKPEYLVSLYLILNKQEEVSLKDLCNYGGKLNKELKENNIEAMFLYSDNYIEEMLERYSDYFLKGTYTIYYAIKRKVSNEVLSEKFTAYLSNDVLKVISELHNKEKKMTTEEKIEVMNAYTQGKQIQFYDFSNKTWEDVRHEPVWDWDNCLYRIKPESKYRPYKDLEEFKKDIVRKYGGSSFENIFETRNIWLKHKYTAHIGQIIYLSTDNLFVDGDYYTWKTSFANYTYLDGTPFGIKE